MPCTDRNPLTREGTSLLNRMLEALQDGYAQVEERDVASMMLFARRYAFYLNYYDAANLLSGDWQELMQKDISVVLATLMKLDLRKSSDYKKLLFKRIKLATADGEARRIFKFLFDFLFSLVRNVDLQVRLMPDDLAYKNIFRDVIRNKLQYPLANLEQTFNDYKTAGLLDYSTTELDEDAPVEAQSDGAFSRSVLISEWQTAIADINITVPPLATDREKIAYIINHNIFVAQIENLLNAISSVVRGANDLFNTTIADFSRHSPHYALFIAFLKLFVHEHEALNQYTKKHLDFYYKEVLRLGNKAPEADTAHLLFELQKPVMEHLVKKETLFKGGKDVRNGKEIQYLQEQDIVVNKAVVSKMYSTQIVHEGKDFLKACVVANSDDGQGAKLQSIDKSWYTFGDPRKIRNAIAGFAVVSNILFLNEGTRHITVTVLFSAPAPALLLYNVNCFSASYSGRKKWIAPSNPTVLVNPSATRIEFRISLTPDDPALAPYDESIHAENLGVSLPVLKIFLNQDASNGIPYTLLCKQTVSRIFVRTDVTGIRDIMLSHDGGAIDASKPFKPFGDFPGYGAGFYLGSKEIFQKPLTRLELNTQWKSTVPVLNAKLRYLRQNVLGTDEFVMAPGPTGGTITFTASNPFRPAAVDFEKNESLTATTREGFLQVRLNESQFSLASHLQNISSALSSGTSIKLNSGSPPSYSVQVAATPVAKELMLNSFSVNYSAATELRLGVYPGNGNNVLLHLSPFGFKKVADNLVERSPDVETTVPITLLQDFRNTGELYLGFEGAEAKQVVTVLFQVAEGSSNPLRNMESLGWYYLADNNNWKIIQQDQFIDETNNLTQSGIVTITWPADIGLHNAVLGEGFHWIKVTVNHYTDAVCKTILVQAQAAKVKLVQDDTKEIEFRQLLPSGTVSKLLVSDAAIKKIQQPFDSFGGRLRETDDHFYVRVSERLRHKQRAITIWDYEHIVLEKFQKIFKVKCLNHSGFYEKNGEEVFCENYPGHVTIVTIPNLNQATNINPLRPYTPVGLLKNIEDYLKSKISPFVVLHVKNPQLEEIQLDFKVKFHDNLSESFYMQLLNAEIEKYLSPWAFDHSIEISFGGMLYKSALINFVEERSYVDYVTCFKMHHMVNRGTPSMKIHADLEVVRASTSRSILVSYFDEDTATRHIIQPSVTCAC